MSVEIKFNEKVDNRLEYISSKAKTEINDDKDRKVFVIVPDQFNFDCQKIMLEKMNTNIISQIEVLSFNRLVYRIYEEANYFKKEISDIERLSIISNIIDDKHDELKFFGKYNITNKIIIEINNIMKLIVKNVIDVDKLKCFKDDNDIILSDKIHDISLIYETFTEKLLSLNVDIDVITPLKSAIDNCKIVDNCSVFISEFYNFTNEQLEIIRILERANAKITIVLQSDGQDVEKEKGLFAPTNSIVNKLRISDAKTEYLECSNTDLMDDLKSVFTKNIKEINNENISLNSYSSKEREIFNTCLYIKELIHKGYRYSDISLVVKKLPNYELKIRDYFDSFNIPFFMEYKKKIENSKIVRSILKMFEVSISGFSNSKILTFVKENCYADIDDETIFNFENYVLKTGIEYFDTLKKSFEKQLKNDKVKAREKESLNKAKKMFDFISDIKAKFDSLKDTNDIDEYYKLIIDFIKNDIDLMFVEKESKETEKLLYVLDEWKNSETKKFDVSDYLNKLKVLLDDVCTIKINETIEQVRIYDSTRANFLETKVMILCGFNNASSDKSKLTTLFTEKESEKLCDANLEFNKKFKNQVLEERFLFFNMIEKVSEKLMINYTRFEDDSEVEMANELITLSNAIEKSNHPFEMKDKYMIDNLLDTDNALIKYIYLNANEFEIKKDLIKKCMTKIKNKDLIKDLLEYKKNLEVKVDDKKDSLELSFSAIERYVACPFSYFLQYKLGVKERDEMEYDAATVGNIAHELFERFFNKVASNEIDINASDNDKIISDVDYILDNEIETEYLKDDKNQTIYERYKNVLHKNMINFVEQIKHGEFQVKYNELEFGKDKEVVGIEFIADDGTKIYLGGKIDRYDEYVDGNDVYLKVIDYKTGKKKFSVEDVLQGKNMQLVIYLKVLLDKYRREGLNPIPAGIFLAKVNKSLKDDEEFALKDNKLDGLYSDEEKVLMLLDKEYRDSKILPLDYNKDGSLSKNSLEKSYSKEMFEDLTEKCFETTKNITNEIVSGQMNVCPTDKKLKDCSYCPYINICGYNENF